jgi:hypothetical protein
MIQDSVALGQVGSVAMVLLIAAAVQMVVPPEVVRSAAAAALLALGLYKSWHHRHPRYGGMDVGFRDLAVWSFLMASAHGAGLMVLPFCDRRLNTRVRRSDGSRSAWTRRQPRLARRRPRRGGSSRLLVLCCHVDSRMGRLSQTRSCHSSFCMVRPGSHLGRRTSRYGSVNSPVRLKQRLTPSLPSGGERVTSYPHVRTARPSA